MDQTHSLLCVCRLFPDEKPSYALLEERCTDCERKPANEKRLTLLHTALGSYSDRFHGPLGDVKYKEAEANLALLDERNWVPLPYHWRTQLSLFTPSSGEVEEKKEEKKEESDEEPQEEEKGDSKEEKKQDVSRQQLLRRSRGMQFTIDGTVLETGHYVAVRVAKGQRISNEGNIVRFWIGIIRGIDRERAQEHCLIVQWMGSSQEFGIYRPLQLAKGRSKKEREFRSTISFKTVLVLFANMVDTDKIPTKSRESLRLIFPKLMDDSDKDEIAAIESEEIRLNAENADRLKNKQPRKQKGAQEKAAEQEEEEEEEEEEEVEEEVEEEEEEDDGDDEAAKSPANERRSKSRRSGR